MKHIRRTAALGIMTAIATGTVLASAAPAQAWCAQSGPNPVYGYRVCSGSPVVDCWVSVLGDTVFTCP